MLDEVKKELVFEPNEYGTSLELAALEDATALSTTSIVLALVSLVLVAAVAVIVVIVIKKKKASK